MSHFAVPADPQSLVFLLVALAMDAYAGDLRSARFLPPGPGTMATRLAAEFNRRLNRPERGASALATRGLLLTVAMVILFAAVGLVVMTFTRSVPLGWLIEVAIVATVLTVRAPYARAKLIADAIDSDDIDGARDIVRPFTPRARHTLDGHALGRVALEGMAVHLNRGVVGPCFWYLLLGLPGLLGYVAVSAARGVYGHDTGRFRDFGRTARALDEVVNVIPAFLAGLLVVIGAVFAPGAAPWRALMAMTRFPRRHPSVLDPWPVAALAGAYDLALAGPQRDAGERYSGGWIGSGRARVVPADVRRGLVLYLAAGLVVAAALCLLLLARAAV